MELIQLEVATLFLDLIGQKGQFVIDVGVYMHRDGDEDKRDLFKIGSPDAKITADDCKKVIEKIRTRFTDFDPDGRSYFFEGINKHKNVYEFIWGS